MTPPTMWPVVWAAPAILVVLIAVAVVTNRSFLAEAARRRYNAIVFRDRPSYAALRATLHAMGDNTSVSDMTEPVAELALFCRNLQPDYVMGVHVGGRLLSTTVCDVIGLDRKKCLFVSTHRSRNELFTIEAEGGGPPDKIEGSLLIIDDISRTGNTLRDLKNFLHRQNYDASVRLSQVTFAVLVVADKGAKRVFVPDWAYFHTDEKYFKLPWTDHSLEVATAYDRRATNLTLIDRGKSDLVVDYNEYLIEEHEAHARHFAEALNKAAGFLRMDEIRARVQAATESARQP